MMIYRIRIRPKALKFIEKQDKNQRIRIYSAIYNLPDGDVKKLVGCKDELDFEFGDYRIIYNVNEDELLILVTKANNRGQVYK